LSYLLFNYHRTVIVLLMQSTTSNKVTMGEYSQHRMPLNHVVSDDRG